MADPDPNSDPVVYGNNCIFFRAAWDVESFFTVIYGRFSQYNPENVAERDFLRTEGDPGAAGYTIKEAIALIRSIIPAQRAFSLQLLASVLHKCLHHLQWKDCGSNIINAYHAPGVVDWQAVWAYALGPEPEIALALRIALDDNHNSVILACAKVIHCVLCCDVNENYFDISEKLCIYEEDIYTAPVFRSRPEIDSGYLRGGFWKYSTKPSNVHPFTKEDEDAENEEHTIQDDVVVAGQDVAAGLVRMGILPRICYLLEMDPLPTLDECLVSILIALARHSPSCVAAIMKCPRLIETVVRRFNEQHIFEAYPSKIKSVVLLRVLSQADKKNCLEFVKLGFFREMMWHMYKDPISIDNWVKSGKEHCKLTSGLIVEQLRFWKVCVCYGYCISYFEDFFPSMCMWLGLPTFDKLIEENILGEFTSVTWEAYHVLEALSHRLPRLHSAAQLEKETSESYNGVEFWSWSRVVPMVELATKWLSLKTISLISFFLIQKNESSLIHILWVISAIMHMLYCIFERIAPRDSVCPDEGTTTVPWLPFFIPKVGLEIVKNGFFNFLHLGDTLEGERPAEAVSLLDVLCQLRSRSNLEASFSSVSCLHGLVLLAGAIDKCIQSAKGLNSYQPQNCSDVEDKILHCGIVNCARIDLVRVLTVFGTLVASEWQDVQSIEMFGRGGPAPGVGVGWGSSGGGFWSKSCLLVQVDAHLIMSLLRIFPIVPGIDLTIVESVKPATDWSLGEMAFTLQRVNAALGICLASGPRDIFILEKALDILLQVPVLEFLGFCVNHFIQVNKGLKSFQWQYYYEDYQVISKILSAHFRNMWLTYKNKSSGEDDNSSANFKSSKKLDTLETIFEDLETSEVPGRCSSNSSLQTEWARQKLPIPVHWFLSPLSCMNTSGDAGISSSSDSLDVAKSGLLILLGLEALSYFANIELHHSPIVFVPLVWKLHALSMALLVRTDSMNVLEDEKSKDVYETLQTLYGLQIDQVRYRTEKIAQEKNENGTISSESSLLLKSVNGHDLAFLNFQSEVHENYLTVLETLVEQFGAISYGNVLFGRQVALYLHRSVEVVVRLAAWNSLTNTHVLELLPPFDKCIAEAEGYLEPIEDNEGILEAYSKSWVSGALDKAAARGSLSFVLALHHLSCFIFHTNLSETVAFRNKLVKSLLRDYSRKPQHQKMLYSLIQYRRPKLRDDYANEDAHLQEAEFKRRCDILSTACEGNSSLLGELAKLELS
ncbi:hypothetical protein Taro_025822 [Colocasia esculenta]|uniref:Uncharacterized protein n=1 Tax=Colocasia esculenta TaxID=4460 RepID=A0A843V9V1_COLES|nr:hypothetical protein [Colocasia esculenta]